MIQQIPEHWPSWLSKKQIEHLKARRRKMLFAQAQQPIPKERLENQEIARLGKEVDDLKRENRLLKKELENVYERLNAYEKKRS